MPPDSEFGLGVFLCAGALPALRCWFPAAIMSLSDKPNGSVKDFSHFGLQPLE